MSVTLRLAKLEDQQRCSELLNVLAKATADPHEIFDSDTFEHLIFVDIIKSIICC